MATARRPARWSTCIGGFILWRWLVEDGIDAEAGQTMTNLEATSTHAGSVVKTVVRRAVIDRDAWDVVRRSAASTAGQHGTSEMTCEGRDRAGAAHNPEVAGSNPAPATENCLTA